LKILITWLKTRARKLWLILVVLWLAATLVLVFWGKAISCHVHEEVFKQLVQVVIVLGIGALGHLILTEINTSRERREANRTLLLTALNDIVGAYNEVKSVRRLLRAEAVRPKVKDLDAYVLKEPYVTFLRRINEAQLKLETRLRLIEGNETKYPEPKKLQKLLGEAEGYLGKIISEWEDRLGSLEDGSKQNKLADFTFLRPFLAKADCSFESSFANFADPLKAMFAIIGKALGK